mgnify:FL=1
MANIKKNFNFRNGVQVDDDNLLVTTTGLVGIGTTVPTEALDVRGDVTVTGFATITKGNIGFLTVTTLEPIEIIGAGVSIRSGIITNPSMDATGIVTYYGDARYLQGMPTSQWDDVDVGLGYTSIFNTGGNVGIGTNDPRFTLQVGGKVDAGQEGVGISSVGNVRVSGIVTASSFVGDLTGNIVSASTFSGNIDLNADIDVDGHTNLDNVSITGVTTSTGAIDLNADLDVDGHTNLDNVSISGVTTFASGTVFSSNLDVNADIDVDGHTNLDNLSVAGVSTFTGLVDANGGATIDNIQIGVTGDNEIDTASGSLTIDSANGQVTIDDNLGVTGVSTFSDDVSIVGLTTTKTLLVTGITTLTGDLDASYVGASSTVFATKLGVGTTQAPANDIQVRKSGDAEIQITSETGTARLNIGRETGVSNANNAELRYGGVTGQPYSEPQSLDIVNYGIDNFNYYLSQNNAGAVIGDFHWLKGVSTPLMTLSSGGNLGIGLTTPTVPLQVVGNSNISGDAVFGGDINLTGTLIGNIQGNLVGNVNGQFSGNVNSTTGVSTFNNLTIAGVGTAEDYQVSGKLSIGGNYFDDGYRISVGTGSSNKFIVGSSGRVGIGTTEFSSCKLIVNGGHAAFTRSIGVGKTTKVCAVDFSDAGKNITDFEANKMFMLPPKLTDAQQTAITNAGVVSGAIIYNTTDNKLRVYNGSAWQDLH